MSTDSDIARRVREATAQRRVKTIAERLFAKVNFDGPVMRIPLSPCHVWTGSVDKDGYAQIGGVGIHGKRTMLKGHRVAKEIATGTSLPRGVPLLHACDNRQCVNAAHTDLGDQAENIRQMIARGRARVVGELNGQAKIRGRAVAEDVRRRVANGESQTAIAVELGVTKSAIWMLVHGKNWKSAG